MKRLQQKKNLADPKNRQMEWIKLVCQNREWIDIHGYPRQAYFGQIDIDGLEEREKGHIGAKQNFRVLFFSIF